MEGLSLKINDRFRNRTVRHFNNVRINLRYNSIGSTFGVSFLFNPNNPEHKELACVSHFHEAQLFYNDELIITGIITTQKYSASSVVSMVSLGGYSKTGVLEDCQIPTSLYPLQFDNLSLKEIARKLIKPFKLKMVIDDAVSGKMSKNFKTSTSSSRSTIKDYLSNLASQKNIIISHDNKGNLLFTESKTKKEPILYFDLTKETPKGTKFDMSFNGQGMHSHITLQKQADIDGGNAGEYTIRNPYVIGGYYRPKVKSQTSGDDNDTKLSAQRELSNELKNMTLTITLDRWIVDEKLIKPNNLISILAPNLYIYKKTDWFIESVEFEGNTKKQIAILNCVLPEVYNNEKPISIYHGINEHS